MKPFDHFKTIERFRRQVKRDDAYRSYTSNEYGTISFNHKRWMSVSLFYKEYVRVYGWEFCEKEAENSPIITPDFLKSCHFFEWKERDDFESYLISHNCEDRFDFLKHYIPMFDEIELERFFNKNLNSSSIISDTLILYAWMVENYEWDVKTLESLESHVIHNLMKVTKSNDILVRVRKASDGCLDLSPLPKENEYEESNHIQLDKRGSLAVSLIKRGANLFITGKAGTGKTTLLREILRQIYKKVVVVAPTGVAAKNAVGITIHSFLRLPTAPYFPGVKNDDLYKLKGLDERVIKEVDVIIIDEISMVRCDVLDAMDDVLRHYRKSSEPFGGVQLVMFGDLFQLMPVATDEDWDILKKHYSSPYFFSSKAYHSLNCQLLELTKVYRQNESEFITILNNIREGVATLTEINILNTRYDSNASMNADDSIILTTHNRRANGYNWARLQQLPGDIQEFKASVSGWFPSDEYPAAYRLQLKEGAKVMFVKNDTIDHAYYNGMMGIVKNIRNGFVEVESDGKHIFVAPQRWEHQRYIINKKTKKLDVEVTGSFTQLPLMLAWAVTIHKSQGLTFDKVIIDAERAFTFGQVYVALSRCRTLKGIKLTSRLAERCIKVDNIVKKFMEEAQKVKVGDDDKETQRKHIFFTNSEERTLLYLNSGLEVDEIVKQCGEPKPIVLSHIAKLVSKGKVDGRAFVKNSHFNSIEALFLKHGIEADRKLIRSYVPDVSFADIEIVRAQMSFTHSKSVNSSTKPVSVFDKRQDEGETLKLDISPRTFDKIKRKKKTSYKKVIYKPEDARMFFAEKNVTLSNASGKCPYTLRKYEKITFVSSETSERLERCIRSITAAPTEPSSGGNRWAIEISF